MLESLLYRSMPPKGCEPLRSGPALLASRQDKVSVIAELAGVPKSVFQTFYWEALAAYAAFVQSMPISQELANRLLLDDSLERVIRALNRRRGFLLPTGAEAETIAAETDIWTYAVFLASLLQGTGRLAVDRSVKLFDGKHRCLGDWEPWTGGISAPAKWYRVAFTPQAAGELVGHLAPLLAPSIVPAAGLKWLWSEPGVLACWLGAISDDAGSVGIWGEKIEPYGSERGQAESARTAHSSAFPDQHRTMAERPRAPPTETTWDAKAIKLEATEDNNRNSANFDRQLPEETDDLGRKFVMWLQERLRNAEIVVNGVDASVHRVPKGLLLISPDIFREYDELNWQQVQKRFLKLKLHRKSEPGNNFVTYRTNENPPSMFNGLLIPNLRTMFGDGTIPPITPELIEN